MRIGSKSLVKSCNSIKRLSKVKSAASSRAGSSKSRTSAATMRAASSVRPTLMLPLPSTRSATLAGADVSDRRSTIERWLPESTTSKSSRESTFSLRSAGIGVSSVGLLPMALCSLSNAPRIASASAKRSAGRLAIARAMMSCRPCEMTPSLRTSLTRGTGAS